MPLHFALALLATTAATASSLRCIPISDSSTNKTTESLPFSGKDFHTFNILLASTLISVGIHTTINELNFDEIRSYLISNDARITS